MPAALDDAVVSGSVNTNFKVVSETPAQNMAIMVANQTAHQNRMSIISENLLMEGLGQRAGTDPAEAKSQLVLLESGLAGLTAQMGMVVSAIQQFTKGAQSTPPVTP